MINYEDLDLRILADGNGFAVSAHRGMQSAKEPLDLDLSISWDLWKPLERTPLETQELGAVLWNALIRGSVRRLYDQARGRAGADPDRGVRIRIHLDPREVRLGPFLRLPWEILLDPLRDGKNSGFDPRMPVVRTLDSAAETLLPYADFPLRVLVALPDPRHTVVLDLEGERMALEAAVAPIGIRPKILRQVTHDSLEKHIRSGSFHIVHFLGHGDFDEERAEGTLLLEKPDRSPDPLSASAFAGYFAGKPMPRLVVLNACNTAEPGRSAQVEAFASVAAALVAEGVPAVLAMQTTIRDRSAVRFSARLYECLAAGNSVEEATTEARRALKTASPNSLDWAVPVLLVRGPAAGAQHLNGGLELDAGIASPAQSAGRPIEKKGSQLVALIPWYLQTIVGLLSGPKSFVRLHNTPIKHNLNSSLLFLALSAIPYSIFNAILPYSARAMTYSLLGHLFVAIVVSCGSSIATYGAWKIFGGRAPLMRYFATNFYYCGFIFLFGFLNVMISVGVIKIFDKSVLVLLRRAAGGNYAVLLDHNLWGNHAIRIAAVVFLFGHGLLLTWTYLFWGAYREINAKSRISKAESFAAWVISYGLTMIAGVLAALVQQALFDFIDLPPTLIR